jgi:hypothetical protein
MSSGNGSSKSLTTSSTVHRVFASADAGAPAARRERSRIVRSADGIEGGVRDSIGKKWRIRKNWGNGSKAAASFAFATRALQSPSSVEAAKALVKSQRKIV